MGLFEDITEGIGDIVESIGNTIEDIAESIYNVVADILESIADAIINVIREITEFIEKNWEVVLIIAVVVFAVATAFYFTTLYVPSFQAWVFSSPTLTKLYIGILYVKNYIVASWRILLTRLENWVFTITSYIQPYFSKLLTPVRAIYTYIKAGLDWVRGTILASIYSKLSAVSTFLMNVRLISDVYKYIKEGETTKAIWTILKIVDKKITTQIEQAVKEIQSQIEDIRSETLNIIGSVQRDVSILDQKASYLEDTFRKLYEAFGVPVFGDVAREINRFRRGVIDNVERELLKADSWVNQRFRVALDPIYSFMSMVYQVDKLIREENRLAQYFAYNPYQRGFFGYQRRLVGMVMIPKPIADVILK